MEVKQSIVREETTGSDGSSSLLGRKSSSDDDTASTITEPMLSDKEKAAFPDFEDIHPPKKPSRTKWTISAVVTFLIISVFVVYLQLHLYRPAVKTVKDLLPADPSLPPGTFLDKNDEEKYEHCGSTPQEAEAMGCLFDIMTYGWLHPNCFNATLSHEWETKFGPWEWRASKSGPVVPYSELKYQPEIWGPQGYHVVHCLYSFKLVHMAGLNGYAVSDEAGPLSHTDHCIKTIVEPKTLDLAEVNTRIRNLNTRCVKLR